MPPSLTAEQDALVHEVNERFTQANDNRKAVERQWTHYHGLYHNYSDFRTAYRDASPRDRDDIIGDGKREWGAELFIPYCFATVETILPRMLSQRPRMLVLPRTEESEPNVENMRQLVEAQQDKCRYELKLQSSAKSGLTFGLGVHKNSWRTQTRKQKKLRKATIPLPGRTWTTSVEDAVLWDDPDVLDVDVFDWFWDPFGYDMQTIEWAIHRTWRSTGYVLGKLKSGAWPLGLTEEDVQGQGAPGKYDEAWAGRMRALGYDNFKTRGNQIHEVWEFCDRDRVITILNRQWPVVVGENPAWHGELPFSIYRPTEVLKQMVGKGEIEPIEDLQHEMNTMRSQRRDNATFVLQQVIAYASGFVDEEDLKWGPGLAIPVNGDPRELIHPLKVGDIPNSGYQEEQSLQGDIERATGISDSVSGADVGAGAASSTATGVQLVQAAASERIKQKTRRLESEMIKEDARQFISLNQQRILSNRTVRIPAEPTPDEPERRWAWLKVGPAEMAGEFDTMPEGGSTAPENVPQNRQDAQMALQLLGGQREVDQRKLLVWAMRKLGFDHPDPYLAPPQPEVPPETLDNIKALLVTELKGLGQQMVQAGIEPPQDLLRPEEAVQALMMHALEEARAGAQQGPPDQGAAPGPPADVPVAA